MKFYWIPFLQSQVPTGISNTVTILMCLLKVFYEVMQANTFHGNCILVAISTRCMLCIPCSVVVNVLDRQPNTRYLLAVDESQNTLEEIVTVSKKTMSCTVSVAHALIRTCLCCHGLCRQSVRIWAQVRCRKCPKKKRLWSGISPWVHVDV